MFFFSIFLLVSVLGFQRTVAVSIDVRSLYNRRLFGCPGVAVRPQFGRSCFIRPPLFLWPFSVSSDHSGCSSHYLANPATPSAIRSLQLLSGHSDRLSLSSPVCRIRLLVSLLGPIQRLRLHLRPSPLLPIIVVLLVFRCPTSVRLYSARTCLFDHGPVFHLFVIVSVPASPSPFGSLIVGCLFCSTALRTAAFRLPLLGHCVV